MARVLLGGNVLWLSLVSLLNDAASEMIYPLLPLFLVGTLGASMAVVGLIEGIAESTSSLLKLISGWWSDRMRARKPAVVIGYSIAAVARPLVAIAAAPWHVLAIRFADRTGKGLRSAPRDALLAESVSAAWHGRAFGVHRAADHAGAVIGPLIASLLLLVFVDRLRLVFAAALIPGLLAVLLLVWRVREPAASAASASRAGGAPGDLPAGDSPAHDSRAGHTIVRDSATPETALLSELKQAFRGVQGRFLIAVLVFTLGNATDAFLLLRAQDVGVPVAAIPLLWALLHVSKSGFSVPGGAISDRFGARRTIGAGWLLYAAVYAGFAVASAAWHAWALFAAYGLYYGLTESPEKALVASFAREHGRGTAFGAYHFTVGAAALPASVIFGILWQSYGAGVAFGAGALLALIATLLLAGLSGRVHEYGHIRKA